MRNPVAAEIFNEEVSNLLKRKIKNSLTRIDELGIAFDYEGEVTAEDAREILDKVAHMHSHAIDAATRAKRSDRKDALRVFAANLHKAFYGFEPGDRFCCFGSLVLLCALSLSIAPEPGRSASMRSKIAQA